MRDFTAVDPAIRSKDPDDVAFERLYGPWQPFTAAAVARVLAAYGQPWWIAGGQALEAFTGVARHHEDIDVGFFHADLDHLRSALSRRYHLWSAGGGMLRPLDEQFPTLHTHAEQVWVREHAWAPWRMDMLATPDDNGRWVNKRERSMVLSLDEATWTDGAGVRFLRPDLVLLMKARHQRPKDELDFEAAVPLLEESGRARLRGLLQRAHPGHPWLLRL